jgi:ankyrin repeat protein
MARMGVAHGEETDDIEGEGWTRLLSAAMHRSNALVKELLSQPDVRPNACRVVGVTSRCGTASAGWEAVAALLIGHPDIDVNATTDDRNTALFRATKNSRCRLFEISLLLVETANCCTRECNIRVSCARCWQAHDRCSCPSHHKETIMQRAVTV